MTYFVYILYSEKDKKLYTGCTNDISERIKRHNEGRVKATRLRRPLTLIHLEQIEDKGKAFNRERFLKSLWGSREKKKIKENFFKLGHSDRKKLL